MVKYITLLRAIAAIIITNSHYTEVYPISIIASGGLLGDIIFFAVSGFGLANVKLEFKFWYVKRILKIYPAIWIITSIYLILGFYTLDGSSLLSYFIYPTYYHFIGSIIILYIPYYIIAKNNILRENIIRIMIIVFIIYMVIYLSIYDTSYYHIDTVREPMIRFLFFESMLLGLYFRDNHHDYVNKNYKSNWIKMILILGVYFISKLLFTKIDSISSLQFINQLIIFSSLYHVLKSFSGIENQLDNLNKNMRTIIKFIADITLQIYAVQYVIIPEFSNLIFPINWIVITFLIILTAYILFILSSKASNQLLKVTDYLFKKGDQNKITTNRRI